MKFVRERCHPIQWLFLTKIRVSQNLASNKCDVPYSLRNRRDFWNVKHWCFQLKQEHAGHECAMIVTCRVEGYIQFSVMVVPLLRGRTWNTFANSASALSPASPAWAALSRGRRASSRAPQNWEPVMSLTSTNCNAFCTGAARFHHKNALKLSNLLKPPNVN